MRRTFTLQLHPSPWCVGAKVTVFDPTKNGPDRVFDGVVEQLGGDALDSPCVRVRRTTAPARRYGKWFHISYVRVARVAPDPNRPT